MKKTVFTLLTILCAPVLLSAQSAQNRLTINADMGRHQISRHIYGHFSEHLGHCIYGGIWVGKDSSIPNTNGVRTDIIDALKKIKIPNIRWPGGCFADEYHWKDGIGPAADRPSMINTHWGGVVEDNSFGTHEFLDFCEAIDAEPYVSANVGSGTVEEMADWVEYINSDEDTPMTRLRRQNGRDKSWGVKYWAVGNENWGCGGDMTPEYYSDLYRRFAIYCRNYGENRLFKVACGASDYDYNWQEVVMQRVGRRMDGISLHYYTVKGWRGSKGSATVFDEAEYFRTIKKGLGIEEVLDKHMTTMDKYDPEKRIALVVDEWGTWFDVEPGTNPGFLYQQSTLRDAFVAANTLNLFNERCERIKMANIAQTVNVLQAIILTKDEKMILTPTYHVFDMYQVHQDATLLPSALTSVDYVFGDDKIPALNASCSRGSDGTINISIANAHPQKAIDLECELRGANVKTVSGRLLTAENLSTHNTFDKPDNVKPVTFKGASLTGQNLTVKMPARSIVVLQLK